MGLCNCLALLVVAFAAVFAFYFANNTVPRGIHDGDLMKFRLDTAMLRMAQDFSALSSKLGYDGPRIFRMMLDKMFFFPDKFEDIKISEAMFDGVPVRVYEPKGPVSPRRGIIWNHPGGYFVGCAKGSDALAAEFVRRLGAVVFNIDYPRVPDVSCPEPVDSVERAVREIFKKAPKYHVFTNKISIAGNSIGGTLAAVTALRFRDTPLSPKLCSQILLVPWLQMIDFDLPSYVQNDAASWVMLKRESVAALLLLFNNQSLSNIPDVIKNKHITPMVRNAFKQQVHHSLVPAQFVRPGYEQTPSGLPNAKLSADLQKHAVNPHIWPLMAKSLKDLPPAFVQTTDNDVIRDDGVIYAQRLRQDGVKVVFRNDANGFHGSLINYKAPSSYHEAEALIHAVVSFIQANC